MGAGQGQQGGSRCQIPRAPAPGLSWRLQQQQRLMGGHSTWKCRMMVQIRPRVSLGLPSAMSSFLMFTNFTCKQGALSPAHRQLGKGAGAQDGVWKGRAASPGDVGGSPGQSAHSAACGSASSPFLGAVGGRRSASAEQGHSPHPPQNPQGICATEPRVFPSVAAAPLIPGSPSPAAKGAIGLQARPSRGLGIQQPGPS